MPLPSSAPVDVQWRVLLVDDHPAIRFGFRSLIELDTHFRVCGEAAGYQSACEAVVALKPGIVISDIFFGDGNGLELMKAIRATEPDLLVLIITAHDELRYAVRALKSGANGYMLKTDGVEQIIPALNTISSGGTYIPPKLGKDRLFQLMQDSDPQGDPKILGNLSAREREIFDALGSRTDLAEIAEHLGVSRKTAETHREHIKVKLNLQTAEELRAFAVVAAENRMSSLPRS
jgi:DNA-binding NarL/FixJ family response regulator